GEPLRGGEVEAAERGERRRQRLIPGAALGLRPEVQPVTSSAAPRQRTAGDDAVWARGQDREERGALHLAGRLGLDAHPLAGERSADEEGPAVPEGDSLAVGGQAIHAAP